MTDQTEQDHPGNHRPTTRGRANPVTTPIKTGAKLLYRTSRDNALGILLAIGVVSLIVALALAFNDDHAAEQHKAVERVRLECGNTLAHRFQVVYEDSGREAMTTASRKWAEQCALGTRR